MADDHTRSTKNDNDENQSCTREEERMMMRREGCLQHPGSLLPSPAAKKVNAQQNIIQKKKKRSHTPHAHKHTRRVSAVGVRGQGVGTHTCPFVLLLISPRSSKPQSPKKQRVRRASVREAGKCCPEACWGGECVSARGHQGESEQRKLDPG